MHSATSRPAAPSGDADENNLRGAEVLKPVIRPGGIMARRIFVLVAAATFAVSSFAHAADNASDRECVRGEVVIAPQAAMAQQEATAKSEAATQQNAVPQGETPMPVAAKATLEKVFATPVSESIETEDGVMALVGPIEFVITRIGPDGKPVMACVDNAEAARRFFETTVEKLPVKRAQDQ
jgi:hypothetical protein